MTVRSVYRLNLGRLSLGLAGAAALTFNNWLLGPWLNPKLFSRNGSVSELSAVTQPHWQIFRDLDIVSGVLLIVLPIGLMKIFDWRTKAGKVLVFGPAILGAANILDAAFRLPCSETLDPRCSIPVKLSPHHFEMPSHGYSSVVIALCYLALPAAGLLYGSARRLKALNVVSWATAGVAVLSLVSASLQYLSEKSFTVRTSGGGQDIQMLVVGVWLAVLGYSAYRLAVADKRQVRPD